jgi:nucleoid-associated protein EbfC|tara:strand:- start:228 stop:545 length:318 start_codon:yes stop_codon:yes gene_type:complete
MTDFNNIIEKAKELEAKMKESQKKIKDIKVEGISGANSVKVFLNGEGEMIGVDISPSILSEEKTLIEDLIVAAHNNAKIKLKSKTAEEISKVTGGLGVSDFKWPT